MAETWTSRKRLLAALECRPADRVPISTYELVGYNSRAWENHEPSYQRLMDEIRARTDCIAMWNCGGDGRFLHSAYPVELDEQREADGRTLRITRTLHTPRGDLRGIWQEDARVHTTWTIEPWCKNVEDVDRALSVPYVPVTPDPSDHARIRAEVGEHGILMPSVADPMLVAAELMSFQDYLIWAFEHTEHFARTVAILSERVMENLRRELGVCTCDLYRLVGPEYMTPPYMPPSMFRRFVLPYAQQMTQIVHDAGARLRLHCHGKIAQVLEMILDSGCDGIDPCEPPPDGDIQLDALKRKCAAREVCVFGNIELRLLETARSQQIRELVRIAMQQAKDGGGFVLMPTAAPIDVPLSPRTEANYIAYIDAGLEFGAY